MKLQHLSVSNFIGIGHADLYFEKPIQIFIGPNWSGKSSLACAWEFLFTGTARSLKTKRGSSALVHEGAKQAAIVASFDNGITLRRSRSVSGSVDSFRQVMENEEFDSLCEPFSAWNICSLSGERYVMLDDDKRKEMLFNLLSDKLTVPAVNAALIDAGIHETMAIEWAETVVKKGFKKAAEEAVEERRAIKRMMEEHRRKLQAQPVAEVTIEGNVFDLASADLGEAGNRLRALKEERDAKLVEKGKLSAASRHLAIEPPKPRHIVDIDLSAVDISGMDLKKCQGQRTALSHEREQLLFDKGKLGATLSPAQRTELEERLAKLRNDLVVTEDIANDDVQSLQLRKTDAAGFIEQYAKQRKTHESAIQLVRDNASLTIPELGFTDCPIMEGVTCPVPIKTRKQFGKTLDDRRKRNQEVVKENEGKLAVIDSQIEEAHGEMRKVDTRIEEIERAKGRLPDLRKDIERLEADLSDDSSNVKAAEIETKLADVAKRLDWQDKLVAGLKLYRLQVEAHEKWEAETYKAPETVDSGAVDKAIAELSGRMETGTKFMEAVVIYRNELAGQEKAAADIEALVDEVAAFDKLAKALEPDGIQSDLVTNASEQFQERMKHTAEFFGAKIGMSEEDFLPRWQSPNKPMLPYQLLSKSEQWLTRLCFQDAIAFISKTPLLVIDEADILAPENKDAFIRMLLDILPSYTNIFAMATEHDISPSASDHPAIDIWAVADGLVNKLEHRAAAA